MNLNNWLNNPLNAQGKINLVCATKEHLPLVNLALDNFKANLGEINRYSFTADRYFDFNNIINIINSGSLFIPDNYIEINYKTKPTLEQQKQIQTLLNTTNSNNTIIITCEKLNKKELSANWLKAINGLVISITESDSKIAVSYILQQHNLNISNKALENIVQLNQANISQLLQETTKLALIYPTNTTIDIEHIEDVDNSQYNVYQLSSSYLNGNKNKSITILENIYQEVEDAILIMWMINDDLRKLIRLKGKIRQKIPVNQAIQELKVWGDAVYNLPKAEQRLSYTNLLDIFYRLSQVDLMIKGVIKGNIKQELKLLVLRICQ